MAIDRLDHYSIRTFNLAATEQFYTQVMGFEVGPRPEFPFPGIWLYMAGRAVVHVIGIDPNDTKGLHEYLGDKGIDGATGGGAIDHIAFVGQDYEGLKQQFAAKEIAFRERLVPSLNLAQLFLEDPSGVTIELNFPQ